MVPPPRHRTAPFSAQYSSPAPAPWFQLRTGEDRGLRTGPPGGHACLAAFLRSPQVLTSEASGQGTLVSESQPQLPWRRGDLIPGGCDLTGHSIFSVEGDKWLLQRLKCQNDSTMLHTSANSWPQKEAKTDFSQKWVEASGPKAKSKCACILGTILRA